jgi:hypothetical protein
MDAVRITLRGAVLSISARRALPVVPLKPTVESLE